MCEWLTRVPRLARAVALVVVAMCVLFVLDGGGARAATGEASSGGSRETIEISVGIPPLAYLIERIGGGFVSVSTLLVSGQDPHTFEPTPRQVVSLIGADIYFSAGLPFEERMVDKIRGSGAQVTVVELIEHADCGHHCEDDGHGHEDPHVWLSPAHLEGMARAVAGVLSAYDPEHSEVYERNLRELCLEIEDVDNSLRQMLTPFAGREFLTYHSVLGHIAREYGLVEVSIESEGKSPGAKGLASIIERARSNQIRVVFVQPQFDDTSAKLIARAIGASVVSIDPLKKDVLLNLLEIAEQLVLAMD